MKELEDRARLQNSTFGALHSHCEHDLMAALMACIRLDLLTANHGLGRDSGVLTLPAELLAADGLCGRDSYGLQLYTKWGAR